MSPANHLLTVEISSELYAALQEKVQRTGQTESDLLIQGLQQILDLSESMPALDNSQTSQYSTPVGFALLETALESRLKEYVEKLISDRLAVISQSLANPNILQGSSSQLNPQTNSPTDSQNDLTPDSQINVKSPDIKSPMPMPTIRPLQVGDRVLVLEPDSPYYMAKLLVIKTSLIRATVETETGEKTFLKRDLRFVEAAQEQNN